MNNQILAQEIISKVGGKANIVGAWHCITRLRFNLSDGAKVDIDGIKALEGVLTAKFQGDQFQVVIGNNVANVYTALKDEIGDLTGSETKVKQKINPINVIFDTISGIFNPIMPAIIGAGLLKGFMSLFLFFNWLNPGGSEYFVLNMISDAAFYFLPFLLAFSAAKKFNTNEFVAVSLAGILMYPAFAGLEEATIKFFFLKIPVANYSSSVIPIILGVLLLSFVYRFFNRWIPKMLRLIFAPLLSLLVTAPIVLFLIAPIGSYIGVYLANFFVWLFDVAGPLAGFLLAGFMPFIIMTGMHYALFPVALDSLGTLGYDIMLLPMNLVNNLAQCGATLAVGVKSKNKETRSLAFSCALSAAFGITEPAMYGVTLKRKKPMYAAMIGSGIGGAIFGLFVVKAFAFSIPGITAFPGYMSEQYPSNLLFASIGSLASFLIAFLVTFFLSARDEKETQQKNNTATVAHTGEELRILSPLSGKSIPLSQLEDSVFANEVLGKGIGILPSENVVKSPFDGTVSMVTDTKHALGITSREGVELLIHIGMNTVSLNGQGFESLVESGQAIVKGQPLLTFNPQTIEQNQLSTASAVIVTNTSKYAGVSLQEEKSVTAAESEIITITV